LCQEVLEKVRAAGDGDDDESDHTKQKYNKYPKKW